MNLNDFIIEYKSKKSFPDNSIIDLELISRYNSSKEDIYKSFELITKCTNNKKKEISDMFNEKSINNDIFELAKIPKQKADINKFPLGKLKRDLCIDNGIIR